MIITLPEMPIAIRQEEEEEEEDEKVIEKTKTISCDEKNAAFLVRQWV